MKSNRNMIFILVGLIGLAALIWFFTQNMGKRYNWNTSLDTKNEEPYDLSVFSKTLEKKYPKFIRYTQHTVRNLEKETEKVDYFAVGYSLNYRRKELDSLYDFVKKGNNLFLSYKHISDTALMKFGIPKYSFAKTNYRAQTVHVNFTHPQLKKDTAIPIAYHKNYIELNEYAWQYMSPASELNGKGLQQINEPFFEDAFDEAEPDYYNGDADDAEAFVVEDTLNDTLEEEDIGMENMEVYIDGSYYFGSEILDDVVPVKSIADVAYIDSLDKVICKRYQVGEGYVYILSTPIMLSNFYCSNDTTMQVPLAILSHFKANKCILDLEATGFKMGSISVNVSNTPLRYFLSKKWFKAGFYLLMGIAFLFVILSTYRTQRPVPVFNLPENKSIEQIKNIAAVLYHEKDIARLKLYLKDSYAFWKSEHESKLKNVTDNKEILERLDFLSRKDIWDANHIKEFQIKYNQLKSIYGN